MEGSHITLRVEEDCNQFTQELFGQILPFWDDRLEEENETKVNVFIKKVADIA